MSHFGIISPPVSGHLHPFGALGRELLLRGHRVTALGMADVEEKIRAEGLEFIQIGQSDHPSGSLGASMDRLGRLQGFAALRFTIRAVARTTTMVCRDAPAIIRDAGIEALLVDQMEPAGGAVAEHLGIPFVTVCNALAINRDPVAPPAFAPWQYKNAGWTRWRNLAGYAISDWLTSPIADAVGAFRTAWGLPELRSQDESFSRLAQICQMPREFDFPRTALPEHFHYVGPLRRPPVSLVPFPWDRLDGRPIVYASLGTLQNTRAPLFRCFAEATRGLGVQLVISHGGGLAAADAEALSRDALVVPYAPQMELLGRASLTITHGGLNTVLDSLANGIPAVAIPITYEQPAIARRLELAGAGRSLRLGALNARRLKTVIEDVLGDGRYREAAQRMFTAIRRAGGVKRASEIIESALVRSLCPDGFTPLPPPSA
jgi:MGT family glycosyltransferase